MAEKLKENRLLILLLLTGAVYFFLRVIAPLTAPVLLPYQEPPVHFILVLSMFVFTKIMTGEKRKIPSFPALSQSLKFRRKPDE